MKKTLFFLLLSLALMVSCKQNPEKEQIAKLDKLCSSLFPAGEPGAAVLVMKGDDIIFDKGYGIADIETKAPIDGNTFFNIASVSKQFTAVAILQLAEEGKLSLEDPVSKYFPEFKADFWKDIQIKHLLSHSSGVPDARGGIPRELKLKGDEALAIAVYSCLRHPDDVWEALITAVNHSGDSDSTGAITGNILGVINGENSIPSEWLANLREYKLVSQVADDLWKRFEEDSEGHVTDEWWDKYPGY